MDFRRSKMLLRIILPAIMLFSLFGWLAGESVQAQSLWNNNARSLYSVLPTKWEVGDLVVVIIVEQAQASQTAGTEAKKNSGVDADVAVGASVFMESAAVDFDTGNSVRSSGKTTRGGSLRAQLTTEVKEIMPNGRLKIEGRQTILVNGEKQEITLTGVIRQEDISLDNTVISTFIADAQITFSGVGTLGNKQTEGLITRFWNWLF